MKEVWGRQQVYKIKLREEILEARQPDEQASWKIKTQKLTWTTLNLQTSRKSLETQKLHSCSEDQPRAKERSVPSW